MINLYDILEAADGQLFGEPVAQLFTDFCFDSQRVNPGELFVALKTDRGDGHYYMADAVAGGATGIMCTHPPNFDTSGLTVIVMRSVEDALMRWMRIILQKYGTTVIGVTGSIGKISARDAIAQVLSTRYQVYQNPGSLGGRFGLALSLGKLTKDHQIAVLEFDSDQPGEMAAMVSAANPLVGVVTHISHDHAEGLTTMDQIAHEKGEMIRRLPAEGLAVLNFDDPLVRQMATETSAPTLTVGLDIAEPTFGADLLAYNILIARHKTGFDLRHRQERYHGRWTPLLGIHQLYAALAALAVGLSYEISLDDGLRALTEIKPVAGRMHPFDGPNGSLIVDDSLNATTQGVLAALDWMQRVRDEHSRLVLVLGNMDDIHSRTPLVLQIGERIAETVDSLITQGDLAAQIGRVAIEQGMPRAQVQVTFNADDAARAANADLGPRDVVLVKGSPASHMERVVRRLLANSSDAALLPRQEAAYRQTLSDRPDRQTWLQIQIDAIAYNTRRLIEIIGPDVALMAVVKSNAYGHGAVPVSTTALNNGATYLGVASIDEALELREAGISAPILILGYAPPWMARQIIQHDIAVTLYDVELARAFDRTARDMDTMLRAHVLVDTGLGLLGLLPDDVTTFFRGLRNLKNVQIEGIYTQFANADEAPASVHQQITLFEKIVDPLLAAGFRFKYVHAANSAAAIHIPESRFNMVRAGIALYGLSPSPLAPIPADFKPAMEWKTTVAQVKRLPQGSTIGYGSTYRTHGTQRIAIIPVGYGSGFRCAPHHWKQVLIKGEFAPLVGRVGMDLAAVDITRIDDVQVGEEVVLIGRQGKRVITVDDVADDLNTISYEVISTILACEARLK